MSETILVTGGTGTLGRPFVRRLAETGHQVRVLSRGRRDDAGPVSYILGDLETGDGLPAALDGVRTVVHLAGGRSRDDLIAEQLVRAAEGRIDHLLHMSVVGADQVPVRTRLDRMAFGYFEAKRKAEDAVTGSGLNWTILRAAQFHQFVLPIVRGLSRLPVIPVPAYAAQPVEAAEVAEHLVGLVLGGPAGRVPDLVGPKTSTLRTLLQDYLRITGKRRPLVPLPTFGGAARAFAAGANLSGPGAVVGVRTWEQFLAEQVGPTSRRRTTERR